MKLKKLNLKSFKSEKKLFEECLKDFNKGKNVLISGGNTLNYFLRLLSKKKITYKKNLVLFDERITKESKKRNFYKINKYLIKKKIFEKKKFFNLENLKKDIENKEIKKIQEKLEKIPRPDLALIGVGDDGHIGSIFPESKKKYKILVISKRKNEKFDRISLNFNYIKKIKKIIIIINRNKKKILNDILFGNNNYKLPVFKLIKIASNKIFLYYKK